MYAENRATALRHLAHGAVVFVLAFAIQMMEAKKDQQVFCGVVTKMTALTIFARTVSISMYKGENEKV